MKPLRLFNAALVLILLVALLPFAKPASAQPLAVIDRNGIFIPGEVVVTLDQVPSGPTPKMQAQALAGEIGGQVVFQYQNIALLSVDPQADVPTLSARLGGKLQVKSAQPNYLYWVPESGAANQITNPPQTGYQVKDQQGRSKTFTMQQLSKMRTQLRSRGRTQVVPTFPVEYTSNQFKAWGWDETESEIVWRNANVSPMVCEIDSGVDGKTPDLVGKVINGYDFINDDAVPNDDNGHGTHVAGIIAALSNNKADGMIGISNGKVLAVKAMNAQGYGTSASVAASLRYCADRADIRVINMSLGSFSKGLLEYNSLNYAIATKNKLVVAAAGNNSTSDPMYPAAWASAATTPPVGANGGPNNVIFGGLISVAAGRSNPAYEKVWIDLNGSGGAPEHGEWFDGKDCATYFSNYGSTVDLVAPGDQIYSTQPVSYPFFNNYYYGYPKTYAYYDGTSMAAPFVAGAAARVLSVKPTLSNTSLPTLKQRLVDTGRPLDHSYQPQKAGRPIIDPAKGYSNSDYNGGSLVPGQDYVKAPFCWPPAPNAANPENPYTAAQDMTHARYLDVSAAMGRVGWYAEATDASTGLALTGAQIILAKANLSGTTAVTVDTALVASDSPATFLLNIPLPPKDQESSYFLYINKPGYTMRPTAYEATTLRSPENDPNVPKGGLFYTTYAQISVPPANDEWVVLDWDRYSSANLDLHVWLPEDAHEHVGTVTGTVKGVINAGYLLDYMPAFTASPDLQQGTLLKGSLYGLPPGESSPYAQLMHNGGDGVNSDDALQFDAVRIRLKPNTLMPYYTAADILQPYDIYVTDYSGDYGGRLKNFPQAMNLASLNYAYPIVRVWSKGNLMLTYSLDSYKDVTKNEVTDPACQDATHDWWHAARILGSKVTSTAVNAHQCGTAVTMPLPYPQLALP
jgi:subtilisin family serine protease